MGAWGRPCTQQSAEMGNDLCVCVHAWAHMPGHRTGTVLPTINKNYLFLVKATAYKITLQKHLCQG